MCSQPDKRFTSRLAWLLLAFPSSASSITKANLVSRKSRPKLHFNCCCKNWRNVFLVFFLEPYCSTQSFIFIMTHKMDRFSRLIIIRETTNFGRLSIFPCPRLDSLPRQSTTNRILEGQFSHHDNPATSQPSARRSVLELVLHNFRPYRDFLDYWSRSFNAHYYHHAAYRASREEELARVASLMKTSWWKARCTLWRYWFFSGQHM